MTDSIRYWGLQIITNLNEGIGFFKIIKEILIMPLCNGTHFEGYIINVHNKTIIHVDSLDCNARNSVSSRIAEIIYPEQAGVSFSSMFKKKNNSTPAAVEYGSLLAYCHMLSRLKTFQTRKAHSKYATTCLNAKVSGQYHASLLLVLRKMANYG